jgi:hypothetical protein
MRQPRVDASVSGGERETPAADETRASVLCAAGACFGVEPSASEVRSDALGSSEIEQRAFVVCLWSRESPR